MKLRITTLNLEQNLKRWEERRQLIVAQLTALAPDLVALNEIHIPTQTGRWLQHAAQSGGNRYALIQQTKAGEDARIQGEGLLTRLAIVETANLDYHSHNCVALAARYEVEQKFLDVYVTHLIAARVEDQARQYQVARLLEWIDERKGADYSIVCGDCNAAPDQPSMQLMSKKYRPTQTEATAFTPLREPGGETSHPDWQRFDRCIDYIWVSPAVMIRASGLCFNRPAANDAELWPSDHVGVWADLEFP